MAQCSFIKGTTVKARMMKIWFAFFLLVAFILNACNQGVQDSAPPAIKKDTLVYTCKTVKQMAGNCGTSLNNECVHVLVKYPLFADAPVLNNIIKSHLLGMFPNDSAGAASNSLQKCADNFVKNHTQYATNEPVRPYMLDCTVSILRKDSSLTTIYFSQTGYNGGVHGYDLFTFINWNNKQAENISLNDLFVPG